MIKLKEVMTALLIILFLIPFVFAISNVQYSVNGTKAAFNFQGIPPFWINIRSDNNIGQPGGYVWARTNKNSFTIDLGFAINPSNEFYYGVKDVDWSIVDSFGIGVVTGPDMLIFISPQYSDDIQIKQALNEYIVSVKEDIGWDIKTIKLTESTNTIGKIRDVIKSHYLQYGTKSALMIGEDTKTQLNSETSEIDSPSTLLWEEFNEPLTFVVMEIRDSRWQGINLYDGGILVGSMMHTVQPGATAEEIDSLFPYYNNNPDNYLQFVHINISKPEVFISLLYPPKEYNYSEKVNKIISVLERFSNSRTSYYGDSIQAFTYVKELALGIDKQIIIDYNAFAELGDLNQTIDCDPCNIDFDKEYKLFIADGHAAPGGIVISGYPYPNGFTLMAMNISKLKTPYFYGHGCNVGGWYSESNLNGILDQTSECKCSFSSTLCCKPIIAEQIFNSDYLKIFVAGGSGSPDEIYWSNFISALKSGKTIAEAHISIKSKIRFVFYGDPTFHYN